MVNREKLITDNINLIYSVLKKMNLYKECDYYFDIGMIGLVKAGNTYDENSGYSFSTYAYSVIKNEILRDIQIMNFEKRKANKNPVYLSEVIHDNGENELCLEDLLPSEFNLEEDFIYRMDIERLYEALDMLDFRYKYIICHTYGVCGYEKMTQCDLSKKLNVSQAQISRLIKKSIKKLRKLMGDDL